MLVDRRMVMHRLNVYCFITKGYCTFVIEYRTVALKSGLFVAAYVLYLKLIKNFFALKSMKMFTM
jgi:hypothetical protein